VHLYELMMMSALY